MKRGDDILVELALRALPEQADMAWIGGPPVLPPRLAARRVTAVREDEALPYLHARPAAPLHAIMAAWPTSFASLIPFLTAVRAALKPEGRALIMDIVWQTAPTPELLRAFAAAPGLERVRPVEGYEMQIEHAGFAIEERVEVDRARWTAGLRSEQRAAVDADSRGAARVVAWILAPSTE